MILAESINGVSESGSIIQAAYFRSPVLVRYICGLYRGKNLCVSSVGHGPCGQWYKDDFKKSLLGFAHVLQA